jgi:hypothetical protein
MKTAAVHCGAITLNDSIVINDRKMNYMMAVTMSGELRSISK